jgi:hypothetical protein
VSSPDRLPGESRDPDWIPFFNGMTILFSGMTWIAKEPLQIKA